MKAKALPEVLRIFDPFHPLRGEELKKWYIDRPHNPLRKIKVYLQGIGLQDDPVHILFTGHKGSGKSTELNRLAADLKNQFFIIHQSPNIFDLTYIDLVLGMATALFQRATESDVLGKAPAHIVNKVWADISQFIEKAIFGPDTFRTPDHPAELSAKVSFLAIELQTKFSSEASTREQIRQRIEPRLKELTERINKVAHLVRLKCRRPVFFIIDSTDKLKRDQAGEIFLEKENAQILTALRVSAIYTFPIELRDSEKFHSVMDRFIYRLLPNLKVADRSNRLDHRNLDLLSEAISLRMEAGLLSESARDQIVYANGGMMRILIRLVQTAAVEAIAAKHEFITEEDAIAAIEKERSNFIPNLKQEDYETLRQCRVSKQLSANEAVQIFMYYRRALLEYSNDEPWCDYTQYYCPLYLNAPPPKRVDQI